MGKFLKKFQFSWYDLDANRHVTNTSYIKACVEFRMQKLKEYGIDLDYLQENEIGPVVLHEFHYFMAEVEADEDLYLEIELAGVTKDYKFSEFAHHMYDVQGEIVYYCITTLAFLDLANRKLIIPPDNVISLIDDLPRTSNFKILTKSDLRKPEVPYTKKIQIPDTL